MCIDLGMKIDEPIDKRLQMLWRKSELERVKAWAKKHGVRSTSLAIRHLAIEALDFYEGAGIAPSEAVDTVMPAKGKNTKVLPATGGGAEPAPSPTKPPKKKFLGII